MTVDEQRLLAELPLPLPPDAGTLAALAIAVAVEDGWGVTLPDDLISVAHLGSRESVAAVLRSLREPS